MKKFCFEKTNYRISQYYGSITRLEYIEKWKLTGDKKSKKNSRITFCTQKHETIRIHHLPKNTNTEFKLYAIGHNLKRIYDERKKIIKNQDQKN